MFNKLKNKKGQGAIEYALIAIVLLAIITVAVRTPLTSALSTLFSKVTSGAVAAT